MSGRDSCSGGRWVARVGGSVRGLTRVGGSGRDGG